jgi:hypothetical protein
MSVCIYFYEPYSYNFHKIFKDKDYIELDDTFTQIYNEFKNLEVNIQAWIKYSEITKNHILREKIIWMIDNWDNKMIESIF